MDDDTPLSGPDTRHLRFLKGLVTVLTATMILGVLAIVVLLVIRLQAPAPPALPASITLPDGATATAFTQGDGWFAVVTADDRILIFDRVGGTLLQTVDIAR
ncbi:MAG: hypothetical protein HKO95_07460 [Rhodobacteraceae bacterium]|jgi:hypothetical protein|nr:hypothetical protein [Alphaproteobacteria bacterium]NNF73253.1 hypothetical protein [Paracoccaceae bacterium]NNK66557.1 hypothetical protein [Paracoccaceae bacterium]